MKQILQSLKNGDTAVLDIPCPQLKAGHVLIRTQKSLISSGTEKMLVNFGKASPLEKIRQQPEKVKMVLEKIKTDGLAATMDAVHSKLDQLLPMGYCNVGIVQAVGAGVHEFAIGDRVVSNGAHAEMVSVPKNLCCKIPDFVADEYAAFTVLGAIGLQGIRLAMPTLGETFVVMGLGLIGLLTVQLLIAQGCHVLAIDIDDSKVELAKQFGAQGLTLSEGVDAIAIANKFSRERGVDGVIIAASTQSNDPIQQAATMCRQRGRIILVGITGLELSRADFYKKELTFQVSCSYGPGRYDASYEEQGHDYPLGLVRWTEQRNFEAFLDMLAQNKLKLAPLISHRIAIQEADKAYDLLAGDIPSLGIVLNYDGDDITQLSKQTVILNTTDHPATNMISAAVIGAGNYASRILIPAFKKTKVTLQTIASNNGISGTQTGNKYGFKETTTDVDTIFSNPAINTVIIASRHDTHSEFVCAALRAGQNIFVEKPLCINHAQLSAITEQYQQTPQRLMVGFNRRFAPHIQKIKTLLATVNAPKSFIMTVNAGDIPANHWTQDNAIGGGRIIGEACHFIDLLRYLAAVKIATFQITRMQNVTQTDDKVSITLTFADGSFGVIHYLANGHKSFPKERLEIFTAGKILQLDNFRKLRGYGWTGFKKMNLLRQDKGHQACVDQFINAIKHGLPSPIPIEEVFEVSLVTLEIATHINLNKAPHVPT
jgi:predicted dehydrogenase/threonine dehydrogenase-like Zn-dependent dehydrogenase